MISLTFDTRPVPWSRTLRGERTPRAQKQRKYIADLAMMLKTAANGETYDGAVSVNLEFDFERMQTLIEISASHRKKLRIKYPDLDNLSKMVFEAIERSGIVENDKQVAVLKAEKVE